MYRIILSNTVSGIATLEWKKIETLTGPNGLSVGLSNLSSTFPFLPFRMSSFLLQVPTLSAEQATAELSGLPALSAALTARIAALAEPAASGAAEKPKRKATKAKAAKEAELLAPVDAPAAAPAPAASTPVSVAAPIAFDPSDPLKSHPSRLAKIDTAKCMGRKIVLGKWVPGTHKDEGGVKKFHPEGQCSAAPATGHALCAKCQEQEAMATSGKRDPKKWFGRLDQPIYEFAAVIGCKQYMECYPTGIKGDPLSVPPTTRVVAEAPAAPKKAKKTKAATDVPAAIAMAELAPVEAEWLTFIQKSGVPAIRNLKTSMVYGVNTTEVDRAKMAKMDDCLGRWDAEKGEIDPYGVPDDE